MRQTLICTVGVSLFYPNLQNLPASTAFADWLARQPAIDQPHLSPAIVADLKAAYQQQQWADLAIALGQLPPTLRLAGAEINSIADLLTQGDCAPNARLIFCHSDTDQGRAIATLLTHYYDLKGHSTTSHPIIGLQDDDPKRFRTSGLRNLVKTISRLLRDYGPSTCALNATGGYKAQIAIAVLLGQALKVPVYYKHERFSEIIAFPPMPISLDFDLWLNHASWLRTLDSPQGMLPATALANTWEEALEPLVERTVIDGVDYVALSATGQIFHEAFRGRQPDIAALPAVVPARQKRSPQLSDHDWGNARSAILRYMQQVTDRCPYVTGCRTHRWNPDLPSVNQFRLKGDAIEGIYSNGSWTVKFWVETSSQTPSQRQACLLDLCDRFAE
ncbi:putative CRISPR-associated protein [Nodosilinea nodulosa]|uniref:putative CRISPR-associated protein n=1 Tax=Nodosilinea nodulosa TaxID=416001 RepID=UPI00031030B4|nr:putative CRISPR-associated protein [Nodosilinea nodulosa]